MKGCRYETRQTRRVGIVRLALRQNRPRKSNIRFSVVALTLVALCGFATDGQSQAAGGTLTLSLNRSTYTPGETMVLTAKLAAGSNPIPVDAYIVVQLPAGQFLSLQLGGGLVPGVVPIARGLVPVAYEAAVAQYTFSGAEPVGAYTWHAVLTRPGTLDFVTPVQRIVFTSLISTPETSKTQLSRALSSGDLETATGLLGNALGAAVRGIRRGDLAEVVRALDTCTVVENTTSFQVCAAPGDKFRFMLVRDERQVWRVIVW